MLALWICHPAHPSAQNCRSVKYLDFVCGSASCIPGTRTCFGTPMKFSFSGKVRVVPPIPSTEARMHISTPHSFLALACDSIHRFQGSKHIKKGGEQSQLSHHKRLLIPASQVPPSPPSPCSSRTPTQTVLSALQDGTQPSHWSCTTSKAARQQSVGN